ncbi:replication factor c [Nesidiocoris tenuis]|uniref:Replication factor c n=1 Tax=Nesidiocoris tenuis TaxID=355587 RepID=A0ABN7AXA8_9HEMI|nr:replication factor c [Nesidiocoris tenuis]
MTVPMQEKQTKTNLPWVEKYRPSQLNDLISHDDIIRTINKFIAEDQLPHLLFYGPPGTGKTSTILACAKQLYTKGQFNSMVMELNASDDRGIGIVRGQILNFASTRTIFKAGYKLIILDEADAMTNDAQNALRRIIEKFTDNVRFCLICNYLGKIIPAIQSRCTRFRFGPLNPDQIVPRLEYVIAQERVRATEDGKKALIELAGGDMRKVLNILQSAATAFDIVDEDNVYTCVGHPTKADMTNVVKWLLNSNFDTTFNMIRQLQINKGLALTDILHEVHNYIHRIELPSEVFIELLDKMAELENRLAAGTSEKLQLGSLVGIFHIARNKIPVPDSGS